MTGLIHGDGRPSVEVHGPDPDEDDEFDENVVYSDLEGEDDDVVDKEGVVTMSMRGEHATAKKKGSRGVVWMTKEDECMVESWKFITTGIHQPDQRRLLVVGEGGI